MRREGKWAAWDDMAVEVECAEFLKGLVRLLKPQLVLESGTGRGMASRYIAEALAENGEGQLITLEPLREYAAEARARLEGLPAAVLEGNLGGPTPFGSPDMVFLDSGPDSRPAEINYWVHHPHPSHPIVVVHDAKRYDLPGGVLIQTERGVWVGRP